MSWPETFLNQTAYHHRDSARDLRFYLADCQDVFRALDPHSVSAIVTSPP
jgi:hypothetical protein